MEETAKDRDIYETNCMDCLRLQSRPVFSKRKVRGTFFDSLQLSVRFSDQDDRRILVFMTSSL